MRPVDACPDAMLQTVFHAQRRHWDDWTGRVARAVDWCAIGGFGIIRAQSDKLVSMTFRGRDAAPCGFPWPRKPICGFECPRQHAFSIL
jgi:hypothetical protein